LSNWFDESRAVKQQVRRRGEVFAGRAELKANRETALGQSGSGILPLDVAAGAEEADHRTGAGEFGSNAFAMRFVV
jgi:hypothetical protein